MPTKNNDRGPQLRLYLYFATALLVIAGSWSLLSSKDRNLRAELSARSAGEGLAVASALGSTMTIVPFDIPRLAIENPGYSGSRGEPAWFSADGRHVVRKKLTGFELLTLDGKVLGSLSGRFLDIRTVAVSPDLSKIAFEAIFRNGRVPTSGFHYGAFGGDVTLVAGDSFITESYIPSESLGWSPDSSRIVYERNGQIRIYNLSTAKSATIGPGFAPTWSPDGSWIAYKNANNEAMMMRPNETAATCLMSQRILGFLHWSPNGQYLLFSYDTLLEPKLAILRLSDRAVSDVYGFGFKGGVDDGYGWVSDYRQFVASSR